VIETTREGEIALLRLCHGKASALDLELCEALERAAAEAEDSGARAIVLTGRGPIFSAGVDLKRLVAGGPDYVAEFLPALDAALLALFRCEKPCVAAINGHAIAGGALLAGACDLRLLARGPAGIAVPELKVGVPFPQVAVEIALELFPGAALGPALYRGRRHRPRARRRRRTPRPRPRARRGAGGGPRALVRAHEAPAPRGGLRAHRARRARACGGDPRRLELARGARGRRGLRRAHAAALSGDNPLTREESGAASVEARECPPPAPTREACASACSSPSAWARR
jgi:hypothetical protein